MAEPGDEFEALQTNSLVRATRVLAERWLIVVLTTALFVAVVLVLDLTTAKQYEASAQLLVGSSTSEISRIVDPGSAQNVDPEREQATALLLARSSSVAARVRGEMNLPQSVESLKDKAVISAEPNADLIRITVRDGDPLQAARLANAFANSFVALRTDANRKRVEDGENLLRRQLDAVPADDVQRRGEIETQLDRLETLKVVESGGAEVVDPARPPDSPASPKTVRDAILALLAGLAAGMALAFIVDGFDRRVKNGEELEELTGLRSLASIPERSFEPATPQERQAALEPYRILRNGLSFLGAGGEVRVVVVSSASSGEGRTTVASGLARACALAGESVVLVEADLRRPSFVERFSLPPDSGGLTSALAGEPVANLLQPLLPGVKTLSVLPAGMLPSNPSELLRGEALDDLLAQLSDLAKIVIIDGPPLLGVADGRVLLGQPRVDACLVVARLRRFDREDGRAIRSVLQQHRLVNAGLVVNGARNNEAEYGYYGASEKSKA